MRLKELLFFFIDVLLAFKKKKKSLPWGYLCIYLKKQKNILTFFYLKCGEN